MLTGKILITGGAGTLGKAIIERSVQEKWDCDITVFSTDAVKHAQVRARWPHVHFVVGDIRDYSILSNAIVGKDVVIHAAAVKHIPVSEVNSIDTFEINVTGSLNVAQACMNYGTPEVLAISTDKACHPANAYGATKYLMEKIWQEYARLGLRTKYHLVRYGNVLESTGSVIEIWRRAMEEGKPIKITNPEMTRFWLSPQDAVVLVDLSIKLNSGEILIPKLKSLSIGTMAEYVLGRDIQIETIPLRPGEKIHETLLTIEETEFAKESKDFFFLRPTTSDKTPLERPPYSSDISKQLTREELMELLHE